MQKRVITSKSDMRYGLMTDWGLLTLKIAKEYEKTTLFMR